MISANSESARRYTVSAVWRFLRHPLNAMAAAFILALVVMSWAGYRMLPFEPNTPDYFAAYQAPGKVHWMGTDSLGRDMTARVLAGARISLKIAFVAGLINLVIGVLYGAISGWFGGAVDNVMMRIVEILYGVPTVLVVILLMVYFDKGIRNIYIAIGLTYWLNMARLVRAEVLSLKQRDFVAAMRALGARASRILLRHVLPNCAGVIIVTITLFIPEAIFTEAFLSYIGLGVPAPDASWGSLASEGTRNLRAAPYLLFFPAAALCLTILAFNIIGDSLRDELTNSR
jgi:oligopeptide transport system permease protein